MILTIFNHTKGLCKCNFSHDVKNEMVFTPHEMRHDMERETQASTHSSHGEYHVCAARGIHCVNGHRDDRDSP